jgi:hypothetical protein
MIDVTRKTKEEKPKAIWGDCQEEDPTHRSSMNVLVQSLKELRNNEGTLVEYCAWVKTEHQRLSRDRSAAFDRYHPLRLLSPVFFIQLTRSHLVQALSTSEIHTEISSTRASHANVFPFITEDFARRMTMFMLEGQFAMAK